MADIGIYDTEDWRRFFAETEISIGVETARPWIDTKSEIAPFIEALVESMFVGLSHLGARVTARTSAPGEDFASRDLGKDGFLFSHHSIGFGDRISRYKHSYRTGYFTFDPLGYAGFSSLAQTPHLLGPAWNLPKLSALDYASSLRRRQIQDNASKYTQPPLSPSALVPGYVFVPLQMPRDTVVRLSPSDPVEFYRRVVFEVCAAGLRCVVKRHPRCRDVEISRLLDSFADHALVTVSDLSVNQLLPAAERVVVINSTVGLEALMHGRPTVTFAACEYAPLTTQISDLDEIAAVLVSPPWFPETRVAQFLQFFFEHHCVQGGDHFAVLRKLQQQMSGLPPKYGWTIKSDV